MSQFKDVSPAEGLGCWFTNRQCDRRGRYYIKCSLFGEFVPSRRKRKRHFSQIISQTVYFIRCLFEEAKQYIIYLGRVSETRHADLPFDVRRRRLEGPGLVGVILHTKHIRYYFLHIH